MRRRDWLQSVALGWLAANATRAATPRERAAHAAIADVKITRVTRFRLIAKRPKFVGKNARLDDHGDTTSDQILRLQTDAGVEGVGVGDISKETAAAVVGKSINELWKPGVGSVGPLARADHALFDLVAKLQNVPAWKLIGDGGPKQIQVYDGSIYFNDLMPQFADRGVARLLEEVEMALDRGHRAFKIKIGRGHKWMNPSDGMARDVDVVAAIRKHVGPAIKLMVDANNGYSETTAREFLKKTAETKLTWIEEPFPESPTADSSLKQFLAENGMNTLVADGESAGHFDHFDPYIQTESIDVLQPDIRAFGLTLQWALARAIANHPKITIAPHNWGSHLGHLMIAPLARALPNISFAEQDTSASNLFDLSGFTLDEGRLSVPDTPGCGLILREDVYRRDFAQSAWTVPSD
jgi:L-alanine-DL-glutamate epimerase-like enolase superfamily enzyme